MSELIDPALAADGVRRRRLSFHLPARPPTGWRRIAYLMAGLVLFPFYWGAGALLGVPGMRFRFACLAAGVRLLFAGHAADAYHCVVSPLDSVRHFEMDFFWRRLRTLRPARVLDVSSPRLLTLLMLRADMRAHADLVNPDSNDLARTRSMAQGLGVDSRCRFFDVLIDTLPADARDYPLVTCMSVLEHIVDDLGAVRTMWDRVAPGGRLLLSVPCAAEAMEEFTNIDEYGLLESDEAGFVFWQRYYDEARLQAIFAITGAPSARALYAERVPGAYDADVLAKRTDPFYPRWREPLATARAYARRDNSATLSGMGVVALEFAKPAIER
ncbi:class I SAM-dependent methyltransferase [Lysobacter niastensis]|uniref:Methyltransferase domain-containing protein n=1 Tax=Lysobacter niastensis TaxID=380629 RepID=A0ABS0BA59_9GAMM|nr:methyltransferase domain-containing protein [Lysobacter niastensis]MBF6025876.1 methyltransferase domain-containing protein [Lysobacter niastensis]